MTTNAWIEAYESSTTVSQRLALVERRATALSLPSKDIDSNVEVLKAHMLEVFLCSRQVVRVAEQILAVGRAHARVNYGAAQQVVGAVYSSSPWGAATQPAIMLTGLAGVGKTECLNALQRLLLSSLRQVELPMHGRIDHVPAWFMSLREASNLNAMLRPYLDMHGAAPTLTKDIRQSKLVELARKVSRRDGTCLAFVDELQFKTQSSQANTLVTSLILQLLSLGPRLVYVCNFSLGHRLKARRQEDRQRLLAHPIVLEPETPESACFHAVLSEYFSFLPEDFDLQAAEVAEVVHRYTFGIKRAVVSLLCLAWQAAKKKRGRLGKVGVDDLRSAYFSYMYTAYREDVEALWRHTFGDRQIREDLVNPFPSKDPETSRVVQATPAIEEWKKQVAAAHVHDLMTPEERAAEQELGPSISESVKPRNKVVRLRREASSKENMLDALSRMK